MEIRIAESLKNLRAKYGLTQEEMAKICEVSTVSISKWERGISQPRMGVIEKLSRHFKIQKSSIIDGTFMESDERTELLNMAFDGRPELRVLFDVAENASSDDILKAIKILTALKGE